MKKSKLLAINAMALALITLFTFVAIPGPVKSAAFILTSIMVVSQVGGFGSAVFASLAMGILSFISNFIAPITPVAIIFRNPLISVVARLFIGPCCWLVFRLVQNLMKKRSERACSIVTATAVGITAPIVNTSMVLLMMFLCYNGKNVEGTVIGPEFFAALVTINFLVELIVNAVVAFPLVYAVRRSLGMSGYLKPKAWDMHVWHNLFKKSDDNQIVQCVKMETVSDELTNYVNAVEGVESEVKEEKTL